MLARLQRLIMLSAGLLAVIWAIGFSAAGRPAWAIGGIALLISGYALFLAAEFLMLALVDDPGQISRASATQLVRAWWGEVKTAPKIFCWRQPFRTRAEPDFLPKVAHTKRGILLIHGFVCNRAFWNPWMTKLRARGAPFIAINLEPLFGSISDYGQVIDLAVARLHGATGSKPVLVAHSMGGLAVVDWLGRYKAEMRIHRIITIGTPHRGTWLARFGSTTNGREMAIDSDWLKKLASSFGPSMPQLFTCFCGNCDNVVFPTSTAMLPGADNRHIPATAHVNLAFRPEVFDEALAWLES